MHAHCVCNFRAVKMFHLSARTVVCMYVCVHVHCVWNFHVVKMFHLSAVSCKNVPCFGNFLSVRKVVFHSLCMCIVFHAVKMFQCV